MVNGKSRSSESTLTSYCIHWISVGYKIIETNFLSVSGDKVIIFDRFLLTGSSKSSLIPFGITDLLLTLETLLTWMTLRRFPSVANHSQFFYQRLSPRPIRAGIP